MKIIVHSSGDQKISLRLPSGLALNPVVALFLPKIMEQNGIRMTRKQALIVVKNINRYRHSHPDWNLVEVQTASGAYVKITI